jgi:hypothetical protein
MTIKKKPRNGRVTIDLTGPQGNAFYLLGTAQSLCRTAGIDSAAVLSEMKSGDYENLVAVFDKYFGGFVTLYR